MSTGQNTIDQEDWKTLLKLPKVQSYVAKFGEKGKSAVLNIFQSYFKNKRNDGVIRKTTFYRLLDNAPPKVLKQLFMKELPRDHKSGETFWDKLSQLGQERIKNFAETDFVKLEDFLEFEKQTSPKKGINRSVPVEEETEPAMEEAAMGNESDDTSMTNAEMAGDYTDLEPQPAEAVSRTLELAREIAEENQPLLGPVTEELQPEVPDSQPAAEVSETLEAALEAAKKNQSILGNPGLGLASTAPQETTGQTESEESVDDIEEGETLLKEFKLRVQDLAYDEDRLLLQKLRDNMTKVAEQWNFHEREIKSKYDHMIHAYLNVLEAKQKYQKSLKQKSKDAAELKQNFDICIFAFDEKLEIYKNFLHEIKTQGSGLEAKIKAFQNEESTKKILFNMEMGYEDALEKMKEFSSAIAKRIVDDLMPSIIRKAKHTSDSTSLDNFQKQFEEQEKIFNQQLEVIKFHRKRDNDLKETIQREIKEKENRDEEAKKLNFRTQELVKQINNLKLAYPNSYHLQMNLKWVLQNAQKIKKDIERYVQNALPEKDEVLRGLSYLDNELQKVKKMVIEDDSKAELEAGPEAGSDAESRDGLDAEPLEIDSDAEPLEIDSDAEPLDAWWGDQIELWPEWDAANPGVADAEEELGEGEEEAEPEKAKEYLEEIKKKYSDLQTLFSTVLEKVIPPSWKQRLNSMIATIQESYKAFTEGEKFQTFFENGRKLVALWDQTADKIKLVLQAQQENIRTWRDKLAERLADLKERFNENKEIERDPEMGAEAEIKEAENVFTRLKDFLEQLFSEIADLQYSSTLSKNVAEINEKIRETKDTWQKQLNETFSKAYSTIGTFGKEPIVIEETPQLSVETLAKYKEKAASFRAICDDLPEIFKREFDIVKGDESDVTYAFQHKNFTLSLLQTVFDFCHRFISAIDIYEYLLVAVQTCLSLPENRTDLELLLDAMIKLTQIHNYFDLIKFNLKNTSRKWDQKLRVTNAHVHSLSPLFLEFYKICKKISLDTKLWHQSDAIPDDPEALANYADTIFNTIEEISKTFVTPEYSDAQQLHEAIRKNAGNLSKEDTAAIEVLQKQVKDLQNKLETIVGSMVKVIRDKIASNIPSSTKTGAAAAAIAASAAAAFGYKFLPAILDHLQTQAIPTSLPEAAASLATTALPEAAASLATTALPEAAASLVTTALPEAVASLATTALPEAAATLADLVPAALPEAAASLATTALPEAAATLADLVPAALPNAATADPSAYIEGVQAWYNSLPSATNVLEAVQTYAASHPWATAALVSVLVGSAIFALYRRNQRQLAMASAEPKAGETKVPVDWIAGGFQESDCISNIFILKTAGKSSITSADFVKSSLLLYLPEFCAVPNRLADGIEKQRFLAQWAISTLAEKGFQGWSVASVVQGSSTEEGIPAYAIQLQNGYKTKSYQLVQLCNDFNVVKMDQKINSSFSKKDVLQVISNLVNSVGVASVSSAFYASVAQAYDGEAYRRKYDHNIISGKDVRNLVKNASKTRNSLYRFIINIKKGSYDVQFPLTEAMAEAVLPVWHKDRIPTISEIKLSLSVFLGMGKETPLVYGTMQTIQPPKDNSLDIIVVLDPTEAVSEVELANFKDDAIRLGIANSRKLKEFYSTLLQNALSLYLSPQPAVEPILKQRTTDLFSQATKLGLETQGTVALEDVVF